MTIIRSSTVHVARFITHNVRRNLRKRDHLVQRVIPDTGRMNDDDRPPICPRCGVTMVPVALSADDKHEGDWVCLECEELDEDA